MASPSSTVRAQVRAWREKAGLRPAELAERVGITRQTLHAIETGASVPNTLTALHLARVLGCTVEDLFALTEPEVQARWGSPVQANFQGPVRVRLAQVGGQWLAFPISGQGNLSALADGVSTGEEQGQVKVNLFGDLELGRRTAVIAGCDPSLALLSTYVARQHPDCRVLLSAVSSKEALRAVSRGEAHAAGIHLYDAASGVSNLPFVQQAFPQRDILLFTLWSWEQGLLVAAGNPKGITGVQDLLRPGVRLQNREPDAGSRVLLDAWLDEAKISPQTRRAIPGYRNEAPTPLSAAQSIADGEADVAPGPHSAAAALGLDFVPLQVERFDLAVPAEFVAHPAVQALLSAVQQPAFRIELRALGGYDPAHAGELWKTTA